MHASVWNITIHVSLDRIIKDCNNGFVIIDLILSGLNDEWTSTSQRSRDISTIYKCFFAFMALNIIPFKRHSPFSLLILYNSYSRAFDGFLKFIWFSSDKYK